MSAYEDIIGTPVERIEDLRLTTVGVPYAPPVLLGLILALVLGSLVLGMWPQPIVARLDAAVRALTFLSQ